MKQDRTAALPVRAALVLVATLVLAACTVAPGAPLTATPGSINPSPAPPAATSSVDTSVEPSGAAALNLRVLGGDGTEAFVLLSNEIGERGDGNCIKTREGERTIREDDLKGYIAGATGVERMIDVQVWLGTLAGVARSLGSAEVVVPPKTNRLAWIVARVPAGTDIDAPVGSLAAVEVRRLDAPAGAIVPQGAEIWFFTGNLAASVTCG